MSALYSKDDSTRPSDLEGGGSDAERDSDAIKAVHKFLALREKALTVPELRDALRLNEADFPFHACRINLLGSNHPSRVRGTRWLLHRSHTSTFCCFNIYTVCSRR
jgi:hypothetical protein